MIGEKRRTGLKEQSRVSGGYRITPRLIKNVATNPIYIGESKWGDSLPVKTHEPLFSESEFWAVSDKISKGKHVRKGRAASTEPLPLSGLLYCSVHNRRIHANTERKHYNCVGKSTTGEETGGHFQIPSYVLDDSISEFIVKQCNFSGYREAMLASIQEDKDSRKKESNRIQRSKKKLDQEFENLKNSLSTARNDDERRFVLEAMGDKKRALASLQPKKDQKSITIAKEKDLEIVEELLTNLHGVWDKLSNKLKNQFFSLILNRIEIQYSEGEQSLEATIYWHTDEIQTIEITFDSNWREPLWSTEEEDKLKKVWPTYAFDEIFEELPNRSYSSIRTKAVRMGLKRAIPRNNKVKHKGWQSWEDDLLRQHYQGRISKKQLIVQTGRTDKAIYERARRIGLSAPRERRLRYRWKTKEALLSDDEYLHACRGDESMSMRIPWRSREAMHMLCHNGFALSETDKRTASRSYGYFYRSPAH